MKNLVVGSAIAGALGLVSGALIGRYSRYCPYDSLGDAWDDGYDWAFDELTPFPENVSRIDSLDDGEPDIVFAGDNISDILFQLGNFVEEIEFDGEPS